MFKRIGNVSEPVVTKGQEVRAETFCKSSLEIFTLIVRCLFHRIDFFGRKPAFNWKFFSGKAYVVLIC